MAIHSLWACESFQLAYVPHLRPACQQRRVALCTVLFLSSDRLTADHKLSASCEQQLHVPTRRKFVSVCNLFCFTCLHNAFMHVDMYTEFISFMRTPHGSRLAESCVEKECRRSSLPQVFRSISRAPLIRGKLPHPPPVPLIYKPKGWFLPCYPCFPVPLPPPCSPKPKGWFLPC